LFGTQFAYTSDISVVLKYYQTKENSMIHNLTCRDPFGTVFDLLNLFDTRMVDISSSQNSRFKADLIEKDSSYTATFDVPGLKRDDVDITFENNILSITTNIDKNMCCEEGKYRVKERKKERLSRSFYLPDVDRDQISATIENGVLTIIADKQKEAQIRKIAIECK
jgi:HSP20 family protein